MSNIISLNSSSKEHIGMCNGLTNVFINVLSLSGSQLAKTVDEKRLIVWLSEKDQSCVGGGTVGFYIDEMPWNPQTFENDKRFLLQVIQAAIDKTGWEKLDYSPNEDLVIPSLREFKELMKKMNASDIKPEERIEWLGDTTDRSPFVCNFPRCPIHDTLLTCFGCQVCNN